MVVMGIDPGLSRIGFGVIRFEHGETQVLDFGRIETSKNLPLASRLSEISRDMRALILQHRPDAAILEEIFFSKNVKTAIKVSHSRGVLMELLEDFGIPIYELPPSRIKMSLTGFGRADKFQMRRMVKILLNLKKEIASDDAADALACALAFSSLNKTPA